MMASAQVVETAVNTNNSPSQDFSTNPDDHSNHNIDSPGFKPFTVISWFMVRAKALRLINHVLISVYIKAIVFIIKILSFQLNIGNAQAANKDLIDIIFIIHI